MSLPPSSFRVRQLWRWLEGDGGAKRPKVILGSAPPAVAPSGGQRRPIANAKPADTPAASLRPDQRAGLVAAFNPSHPIRHARDLRGRAESLDALTEAMLRQRQHAVVHGARGSGKTSLVRIFADRADRQGVVLVYVSCEAKASFGDLMRPFFQTIPAANIPVGGERAFRTRAQALDRDAGPQAVVSILNDLEPKPIIFILDEFDRVTDGAVRDQIATCMKLLSDTLSPVQLLVVGIAQSVEDLITSHPSLRRHVTAISIGPIADAELDRLIADSAARIELPFSAKARALIVEAACGSPYHARLFAYTAGVCAVERQADHVTRADTIAGLRMAFDRWAALNRQDSALFRKIVGKSTFWTRKAIAADVASIARDADDPHADPVPAQPDPDHATVMLAGALIPGGVNGRPGFQDDTAPQFLLALLLLANDDYEQSVAVKDARERSQALD